MQGHSYTWAMNIWMVGGAVRDGLMGLPVTDRDWVVVGQTPQAMLDAGYTPVGKDFPVFLHPHTKDEVALARTERKTAPGYHGFSFSADANVTLEEDLSRRDLTINAMAQDAQGAVIDPYNGQRDLALKLLRHVSPAFAEDPVRILRLARFAARFNSFSVAPETTSLMRQMVNAGEVDALVSERVWLEISRGLLEAQPSRMFEVLRSCGALAKLLPEIDRLWRLPDVESEVESEVESDTEGGDALMKVLDFCAPLHAPLTVRFACLGHWLLAENLSALCQRLRVPTDCRALAEVVAREHGAIHQSDGLDAEALVRLLERCDALRRTQRWDEVLLACECIARGAGGSGDFGGSAYEPRASLNLVRIWAGEIDSAAVAEAAALQGLTGAAIGDAVHAARVAAVQAHLTS